MIYKMALNLLHQNGGKTYSKEEVDNITQKVGFGKMELKPSPRWERR